MATDELIPMPFTEAVTVNPSVCLVKGKTYPFVEMAAVDPGARSVRESERRAFDGGGARFAPGDTLMARITPCLENGKIARFRPTDQTSIGFGSTEFIVIRGKAGVTTDDYAYYLTKWDEFRQFAIGQMTGSSGRQRVPADSLAGFNAMVPSLPVQQRITRVLGKLDDKIELNRRMNRTLEKMAAAIFKSWFIDFDPVHAKLALSNAEGAEGRDPGLPAEVADLFPCSFEESELGPIPKGWTVGPLAEIASLRTRTIQPGKQPDVRWEHYSIPAYDEGQQPKRELGETIKSGKYAVPQGSVLVSKLNPQFPRIWLPWVSDAALAICSTEFMPFVPQHADWRPFLYEMMKSQPLQEAIKAHVTGSTGSRQRAKPSEIAELTVLVPPSDAIAGFSHLVAPLHNRLMLNQRQNHRLSGLRDTLLPKLVSGEIDVLTEAIH